MLGPPRWPRHPIALAKFGLSALQSARPLARRHFRTDTGARAARRHRRARDAAARSAADRRDRRSSSAATAHTAGWAFPRGGSQRLADALAGHLRSLGGEIVTGARVSSIDDLPPCPDRPLRSVAAPAAADCRLPLSRRGTGDGSNGIATGWASSKSTGRWMGRFPGTTRTCARAGTVHLGGTLEEIAQSERDAWSGRICGSSVRAARAAEPFRSNARARRQAHCLGVLSRAARLDRRHAAADRAADRAVRARIPRSRDRAPRHDAGGSRAAQSRTWSAGTSAPA